MKNKSVTQERKLIRVGKRKTSIKAGAPSEGGQASAEVVSEKMGNDKLIR